MTELEPQGSPQLAQPVTRDKEGLPMLLHEALARSRPPEAGEAARQYALARRFTAGRRWAALVRELSQGEP